MRVWFLKVMNSLTNIFSRNFLSKFTEKIDILKRSEFRLLKVKVYLFKHFLNFQLQLCSIKEKFEYVIWIPFAF